MKDRLPLLGSDELSEEQRLMYDEILGDDRRIAAIMGEDRRNDTSALTYADSGALQGPLNALLYSPVIGNALQRLGNADGQGERDA